MAENKQIMLMLTVVERGHGGETAKLFSRYQVPSHYQSMGQGTASSELLDVLGFVSTERDILLSFSTADAVHELMEQLRDDLRTHTKGIACSIPLTGMNGIAVNGLLRQAKPGGKKEETVMEKKRNSLILVMVNQGHTDEVMNTARAAGARGGTIIRSRWAGAEEMEQFFGITLQAEKEIIFMIASADTRNAIMETINKRHGLNTGAEAVVCSVGVEETVHFS